MLAMYPFPELRAGWEAVYQVAAREVDDAPAALAWPSDPHATWLDPAMRLAMTCGWPLVTTLRERVRVVGAFAYAVDRLPSHLYRSMIVADATAARPTAGSVAAINSPESLSGNISLCAAFEVGANQWPGRVIWTGAHVESIRAVRRGEADVASIDAVTWSVLAREHPELVAGLAVIGRGPQVPCLPFIVPATCSDAELAAWRAGFTRAANDPALADVRGTLLVDGFVPLDLADYDRPLSHFR